MGSARRGKWKKGEINGILMGGVDLISEVSPTWQGVINNPLSQRREMHWQTDFSRKYFIFLCSVQGGGHPLRVVFTV